MNSIQKCLLFTLLLGSTTAFGQLTADPEERRNQGRDELKTQTPEGRPRPFGERLRFGGVPLLGFGTGYTLLGVSPVVAYQASERAIIGVGLTYAWTKYRAPYYYPETQTQLGGRAFAMYEFIPSILKNLYAHGEVQSTNVTYQSSQAPGQVLRQSFTSPLVGLTYMQPIARRLGFSLSVLYVVNYNQNIDVASAVYGGSPFVFRIGLF